MTASQPDLFLPPADNSQADAVRLRARLAVAGWQTRKQLCEHFGWSERYVRQLAERLGSEIVRCQAGFKLFEQINRDELPLVLQSSDAFLSQGKRMIRYALSLRKNLHSRFG
jgi:hypothetical protein